MSVILFVMVSVETVATSYWVTCHYWQTSRLPNSPKKSASHHLEPQMMKSTKLQP